MDDLLPANQDRSTIPTRYRRLLVTSLIVLAPVVILIGAWRLGGVSALEDDLIYYLPVRQYIGQQIQDGVLPLWNPMVCMGTSIAADPQSGLWYPPTYLFAILPPLAAYSVTSILHFILAGGGMYRLLRACRHDWRAALLGAIAFEFCGYLIAHRAHMTIHQAAAWMPWIFLGWHKFADTGKYRNFALASLCLGLQMLVQHIQISIITCTLLAGYVVVVLWPRRRSLWWQFPAGAALGAMVSAVQLLPTWYWYADSIRQVPAYYLFIENSWVPTSALMFLFPMLFGSRTPNLWDEPWWGISHFCEQYAYGSILILILATASFVLIRKRREVAFWWVASLIALIIALGDLTPVSKWLFHVPFYRNLRVPARWIVVLSIAMPILASTVLSCLLRIRIEADRLKRAVNFSRWLIVTLAVLSIGIMFTARSIADKLAEWYPSQYAQPVLQGLTSAVHPGNPAIWWPIVLIMTTILLLSYWIKTRRRLTFAGLFVICIVDLASAAAFVDVDTRTYTRSDLTNPPPLADAIKKHDPQPGHRLLVPRFSASYHRPIEVLWPLTNVQHQIAVFNGYGPFWPTANRMLFRFMPWGSSEDILSLLRNPGLMRSMGIRFIAVRSDEERTLLAAAMSEPVDKILVEPIGDTDSLQPIIFGEDVLWPIRIDEPGIYELSFDADPVPGSPSRWFVRLETANSQQIDRTRTMDPVDLAAGLQRVRLLFCCDAAVGKAYVRVKSEMGQALSAGRATFGRLATLNIREKSPDRVSAANMGHFVHLMDITSGISLYELPGAVNLVWWANRSEPADDILGAVGRLRTRSKTLSFPEAVIIGKPENSGYNGPVKNSSIKCQRNKPHDICVRAESETGGFLVFNESYDLGWKGYLDGAAVDIYRANAVCMGLCVPAGGHELRFIYRPRGLEFGAGVSVAAILIILAILIATFRNKTT